MTRRIAALALFLLLLQTGCGGQPEVSSSSSAEMAEAPPRILNIAVSADTHVHTKEAMRLFAQKLEEISQGRVKAELFEAVDPLDLLWNTKDYALAVVNSGQAARADENYRVFDLPFMFRDYRQATMTANSAYFASLAAGRQRPFEEAAPVGAFFGGYRLFVSLGHYLGVVEDLEGLELYTGQSGIMSQVLSQMGARVKIDNWENISRAFSKSAVSALECEASELFSLSLPPNKQDIFVSYSFHSVQFWWLLAGPYANLSEYEAAVVQEAFAYAVADNDGAFQEDQAQVEDYIAYMGAHEVEIDYRGFADAAEDILRLQGQFDEEVDYQTYLALRTMGE